MLVKAPRFEFVIRKARISILYYYYYYRQCAVFVIMSKKLLYICFGNVHISEAFERVTDLA